MKVIKLRESDIKHIVKRVIKEDTDKCITYEELKKPLGDLGYKFKQTDKGVSFKKYCGNVKSVIKLTTSSGGCVERIDERQYVYGEEDMVMNSGQTVWVRGEDEEIIDWMLHEIKGALKYGYGKYKQWIEGCSGLM